MGFKYKERVLLVHVRCPECGVPMMERTGAKGSFYGCSRFPLCIGTRPQGGSEFDSYMKLLHTSYVRATRFLSSPKFMGYADTPRWLLTQAIGREPTEEELEDFDVTVLPAEHLERGIDAACAWASERANETVDFLLNAHEERYASLRMRLKYVTTAEQIQRMPRPEIVRRYDTSDLSQFEADLASNWKGDGIYCPRCGNWSESKGSQDVVGASSTSKPIDEMTYEEINDLFFTDKPLVLKLNWECGSCGLFTRITTKQGKHVNEEYEFESDKNDPTFIKGVTFKSPAKKDKTK